MSKVMGHRTFRHVLAVTLGVVVCMLVFLYTGDSDLIAAVASGIGAVCVSYLGIYALARTGSDSPKKSRPY
jgi:hypothetical protein